MTKHDFLKELTEYTGKITPNNDDLLKFALRLWQELKYYKQEVEFLEHELKEQQNTTPTKQKGVYTWHIKGA
ncbi:MULTISPECIES: hypothetical protein [unclassified Campylobacter]|uniref:hypothetical protein n=1 Tax=unclassified Campylobacter TaxID=2593542 RepID=UPI003D337500